MKLKQVMLLVSMFALCYGIHAKDITAMQIKQNLNQAVLLDQARVQITTDWEKEVHMRDLMARPPRMGAGNPVIEVKKTTKNCQGVLLLGNEQVAVPAVCLKNGDFTLAQVHLLFANGRQVTGKQGSVSVQGDMGYIRLGKQVAQGLRGLPVKAVKNGGLQETFGSSMTLTLHRFFTSFGVAFKNRVCRIGRQSSHSRLTVGEPVLFEGKLVALVKDVPSRYGTISGDVSEDSLALFRS